jgi:FkbM family methyltransferase
MVARVANMLRYRLRAMQVGTFMWSTTENFKLPKSIRIRWRRIPIKAPDESLMRNVFIELFISDGYELRRLPRNLRTVLDIGANVGFFCFAARNRFPSATIHSYEPNVRLAPYLSANASAVGATVFLEAVAREAGNMVMQDTNQSIAATTRADPSGSVHACAFRDALAKLGGSVDLVKMDCEGAEWEILRDVDAWKKVRFVTLEYHPDQQHVSADTEILDILRNLGFRILSQTKLPDGLGSVLAERIGG